MQESYVDPRVSCSYLYLLQSLWTSKSFMQLYMYTKGLFIYFFIVYTVFLCRVQGNIDLNKDYMCVCVNIVVLDVNIN